MEKGTQEQLWQDLIVDHSQFPHRQGRLEAATHSGEGENPLCGDRVRLYLDIDHDDLIRSARFEATGCAISLASASMLADAVEGLGRDQAQSLFERTRALLTGQASDSVVPKGDLQALQLVSRYPLRVKCASLCWHVLNSALSGRSEPVSTE